MKLLFIALFISTICFGQDSTKAKPAIDSLDLKVISVNEFVGYMNRVNLIIMKQFDLTEQEKYLRINKEINAVIDEINRKRKQK